MSKALHLPSNLSLSLILDDPPTSGWLWEVEGEDACVEAVAPIEHVGAPALVALAAWAAFQRERREKRVVVGEKVKTYPAGKYGLLAALAGREMKIEERTEERFLPVLRVRDKDEQSKVLARCAPVLRLKGKNLEDVLSCLAEMLYNVREHAETSLGAFVSVSYLPARDRVTLAVADVGKGIPESIRQNREPEATDKDAIRIALQPYASGAVTPDGMYTHKPDNAGMGLAMIQDFCHRTGGLFAAASLSAYARSSTNAIDPDDEAVQVFDATSFWQGTIVVVSFNPSRVRDHIKGMFSTAAPSASISTSKQAPPEGIARAVVAPDIGAFAQDKSAALHLRDQIILPMLASNQPIAVVFNGVRTITHSVVHALLYEAVRRYGPAALRQMTFHHLSSQVRCLVELVVGHALTDHSISR